MATNRPSNALQHYYDRKKAMFHYGTKGMRWGVRKKSDSGPVDVSVKTKPGRQVKATGGAKHPPSEDAVSAATLHQKAKKSTTDSLSSKELQALVNRMNLERQFQDLDRSGVRASAGKKFVQEFLSNGGKDVAITSIKEGAASATNLVPGGKAAKIGVQLGAAIATAYVNKNTRKNK
jgi:hypothetical protein